MILGELGYRDRFLLTAIGDSVHVAAHHGKARPTSVPVSHVGDLERRDMEG